MYTLRRALKAVFTSGVHHATVLPRQMYILGYHLALVYDRRGRSRQ